MERGVAIVTGGARGIGRGCAHALAHRGVAIALQRTGSPRDVAAPVAFLATAEPMFITGRDITIDGFQRNR